MTDEHAKQIIECLKKIDDRLAEMNRPVIGYGTTIEGILKVLETVSDKLERIERNTGHISDQY